MPEFFLELFSEEIPARMQWDAAQELDQVTIPLLAGLSKDNPRLYFGPRRIAIAVEVDTEKAGFSYEVRGPRQTAPDAALFGFLKKHDATRQEVAVEDGYYVVRRETPPMPTGQFLLKELPIALAKFSWPKSMRWGQSGDFTWVRPLRRIVCLLGNEVLPIKLGPLTASNITEGHRFLGPGAISVSSSTDWEEKLKQNFVIADQTKRRRIIANGLCEKARELGLVLVEDDRLTDEVTGLVEWPVPLIGKIDDGFMDLPPEVRELSMKVNQRYFALRDAWGKPASFFAFVSNIETEDAGKAITAGNERVLRARLSDARYFWDTDLKTDLKDLLPKLDKIVFHAGIGSQRERANGIARLAKKIVSQFSHEYYPQTADNAEWAGRLCKADLVTGMVGEFPELQGIIGGYYAEKNGWPQEVQIAIKSHYQPRGPNDEVPIGMVPCAVALADKLYTLTEFFKIGERPTGAGDPYGLRRAALGVSRIILENKLSFSLGDVVGDDELFEFIIDRLRTKLRSEGKRHDVLTAVFATANTKNILHLMLQVESISLFLQLETGKRLLAAYRRASNILKIEDAKDGPHQGQADPALYQDASEKEFASALADLTNTAIAEIYATRYGEAMHYLSFLSSFVDDFFLKVTINAESPELRRNRLKLLSAFRDSINQIADFSKIEG